MVEEGWCWDYGDAGASVGDEGECSQLLGKFANTHSSHPGVGPQGAQQTRARAPGPAVEARPVVVVGVTGGPFCAEDVELAGTL